jgi:hypothetical protein
MGTVSAASVAANHEGIEGLSPSVLQALGELAGAAREGLLALSVGVGLGVLHELLEAEVDEVVGPRASTSRTGRRSGTAMRPARSRSAAAACRSAGRERARPTASTRSSLPATRTLPRATD